jgi:hypothetical protein
MKLAFVEGGEVIDIVELVNGELKGKSATTGIIRNRMQRNSMSVEEAMRSMHGWSNGYLTTRLVEENDG